MNEKFEDKLIRLAFEETSPKETSALELQAQADPEATRTLESYRKVRIGLNLLADVPPDQLSKERLRNAILGQGLKPLPPQPSRWGWAWMPATACALVFGWLTVRHLNAPAPQIIGAGSGTVAMSKPHSEAAPLSFGIKAPVRVTPKAIEAGLKKTLTPKAHKPSIAVSDEPYSTEDFLAEMPAQATKSPVALVSKKSGPTAAPAVSDATAANPGKLVSINSPMVVINPENDNNSGAQKATEVDGASNVVVGG